MELQQFLDTLASTPERIDFETTIAVIEGNYDFTPTAFTNGSTENAEGENNGSCKIFAFGLLHNLEKDATLACFGRFTVKMS